MFMSFSGKLVALTSVFLLLATGCASRAPDQVALADDKTTTTGQTATADHKPVNAKPPQAREGVDKKQTEKSKNLVSERKVDEMDFDKNLANDEIGNDPELPTNYNVDRIAEVTVPGPVDPKKVAQAQPPAGGIKFLPSPFGGRSGATREKLLQEYGGNVRSEAAVAAGLKWLVRHQALDGHWSLDEFHKDGKCNCKDAGEKDDVLGTALALLPLLGNGQTHRGAGKDNLYAKPVERGLKWLITKQNAEGKIGENTLAQALATTVLCETYAMTADPMIKGPAQRALNYLVSQQRKDGGWDGIPKGAGLGAEQGGWHLMALRSGQLAGLNVPNASWEQFLDLLNTQAKQKERAPGALAAYLHCRAAMGWGRRHPDLNKDAEQLLKQLPDANRKDIDYYFWATSVMHFLGDESWEKWNPKMRDLLIDTQDQGQNADLRDQKGSWSPEGGKLAPYGGRLMQTSLAILTLETYYRYLRRPVGLADPKK